MAQLDNPPRATPSVVPRYVVVGVLALLFTLGDGALGDGAAWAYPAPPGPVRTELRDRAAGPQLIARRRRRRKARRVKRRPRRKSRAAVATPRRPEPTTPAVDKNPAPAVDGALQRGARVEFDGRLVQGQTAKSGAIYLFARKRSELRSMVKERGNYRREILRTVYTPDTAR